MLRLEDILETRDMIDKRHLDIRTITMGISLLDCADPDITVCARKIYDKITRRAEKLVLGKHAVHCGCFLFLHHMLKYDSGTACVSECRVGNRMGEGDQYAGSDECGIYL